MSQSGGDAQRGHASRSSIWLGDLNKRVTEAIESFWSTRRRQSRAQGGSRDKRDRGERTAVTGGKHVDAFADLVEEVLVRNGVPKSSIFRTSRVDLPGFFRPEKKWDLVIVHDGQLIGCVEFKSQVGSFGNNYNNRSEEAIGNATDIRTAYREGAFSPSMRPWIGFLMVLQEASGSTTPVRVHESHFKVFDEFRDASYARRYEVTLTRLVREGLYDQACLLLTSDEAVPPTWREPAIELSAERFLSSLVAHWLAAESSR